MCREDGHDISLALLSETNEIGFSLKTAYFSPNHTAESYRFCYGWHKTVKSRLLVANCFTTERRSLSQSCCRPLDIFRSPDAINVPRAIRRSRFHFRGSVSYLSASYFCVQRPWITLIDQSRDLRETWFPGIIWEWGTLIPKRVLSEK